MPLTLQFPLPGGTFLRLCAWEAPAHPFNILGTLSSGSSPRPPLSTPSTGHMRELTNLAPPSATNIDLAHEGYRPSLGHFCNLQAQHKARQSLGTINSTSE